MSKIGLIKTLNLDKGFGFISTDEEKDIYFNISNYKGDRSNLVVGNPLSYKEFYDEKKKKSFAADCRLLSTYENFAQVMRYSDGASISLRVPKKNLLGRHPQYETIKYHLKKYFFRHLFNNLSPKEVKDFAFRYYSENKDSVNYVQFAIFIFKRIIAIQPQSDDRINFITDLFIQFRNIVSDEVRFDLWRNNNYRLLGYLDSSDLVVDNSTILEFQNKLSLANIKKLSEIPNTENLIKNVITNYLNVNEEKDVDYYIDLIGYLQYLPLSYKTEVASIIDEKLLKSIFTYINKETSKYGVIDSSYQISWYEKLKGNGFELLSEESKIKVEKYLEQLLQANMSSRLKISLFLEDKRPEIEDVDDDNIVNYMLYNYGSEKLNIIRKLTSVERQINLLVLYSEKKNLKDSFDLLENLFYKDNGDLKSNEFLYNKFNLDWLKKYKHNELVTKFLNHFEDEKDEILRRNYFFKGYIRFIDEGQIKSELKNITIEQFSFVINNPFYGFEFKKEISISKILEFNNSSYYLEEILKICKNYFSSDIYRELYSIIKSKIDLYSDYLLWRSNLSIDFPIQYLKENLNEQEISYEITYNTILKYDLSKKDFISCLLNYLKSNEVISNRKIFLKQYFHIKYLLLLSPESINDTLFSENKSYSVIAWSLDKIETVDFETLKKDFIYFPPDEQRLLLKKLFYYIKLGLIKLTIEDLDNIYRIDAELYELNNSINPEVTLDFTVDLVIKSLLSFKTKHRFLIQNELLELLLTKIYDKEIQFSISDFFEECKGISKDELKINRNTNSWISIVNKDSEDLAYNVSFNYDAELVDAIRDIPGRRWDKTNMLWVIPGSSKDSLMQFATTYDFLFDGPSGDLYQDNKHLVKFYREEIPSGIKFCEGRKSITLDKRYGKEFWWCRNQICFKNCETYHENNWRKYNFLDFCSILNLDLTEVNKMGDVIPNGYYYQFTTLLNRFKLLLQHLKCDSCGNILHPSSTGHFGAYTVTNFECVNHNCSKVGEIIYLNHCLNGQCNNVIDSRISKRCSHGLVICDKCGSCCSHAMFNRRLTNLQNNNGYIHPELISNVNYKLGHLERAEYFCYNCGEEMEVVNLDFFRCKKCNVTYDTAKYKFKRENIGFKKHN